MNPAYLDAVRLLLAVAPVIFRKPTFALKGGTAINLFVQDMPREIDVSSEFSSEFMGMTREPVTLDVLLETRRRLPATRARRF